VLAAQGANFTASDSTRAGLANQVQDLLDRLIANANSSVGAVTSSAAIPIKSLPTAST